MTRWRGAARRLIQAAAIALAALLVLGWLGAVHPAFDSVGHFRVHLLAAAYILLIVLAFARTWRTAVALAIVSGTSVALMAPALPGLAPNGTVAGFKVAQQNLLFINPVPEQAAAVLLATGADVLLLQEVSQGDDSIVARLRDAYPAQTVCRFRKFRGVAVLSRAPFVGRPGCERETGLASGRVMVDGRAVTFASLHTYWPWPRRQWVSIRAMEDRMRALPHPLVLGGDFNAAPWSALVGKVAADTRTRLVPGFRFTFNLKFLQRGDTRFGGLPLDHLLHSPELVPGRVALLPHAGSDHLGTLATFGFAR